MQSLFGYTEPQFQARCVVLNSRFLVSAVFVPVNLLSDNRSVTTLTLRWPMSLARGCDLVTTSAWMWKLSSGTRAKTRRGARVRA